MLAGKLCFSQCELVVLPPGLHNRLLSTHSKAIVTVSRGIGDKVTAEERPGEAKQVGERKTPFN